MDEQKEEWTKEQLSIASQVVIIPDPPYRGCRFQSIPLLPLDTSSIDKDSSSNPPLYYGGVDVSFPCDDKDPSVAVYVIVEYPTCRVVYQDFEYFTLTMPYIPSFLAFREIDPLERLIAKQRTLQPELTPKAILVDGNGLLHPRKAGIACFVGVRTGLPTIGVGKTLYYEGKLNKVVVLRELEESLHDASQELVAQQPCHGKLLGDVVLMDSQSIPKQANPLDAPKSSAGSSTLDRGSLVKDLSTVCRGLAVPLTNEEGDVLACALVGHGGLIRAKSSSSQKGGTKNPIYISIGHNISLKESVQVCASLSLAKIPEPVRQADLIGRELLRVKETS